MWRVYGWSLHLISFSTILQTMIHAQNRCTPFRKKNLLLNFLSFYYSYTAYTDWAYHCYLCEGCTVDLCISYHLVPCYKSWFMHRIDVHPLEKINFVLSFYYSYTAYTDWAYHCYLCEGCTVDLCISYHLVPCYIQTMIHAQNRCTPFRKKNFVIKLLKVFSTHILHTQIEHITATYVKGVRLISASHIIKCHATNHNSCTEQMYTL